MSTRDYCFHGLHLQRCRICQSEALRKGQLRANSRPLSRWWWRWRCWLQGHAFLGARDSEREHCQRCGQNVKAHEAGERKELALLLKLSDEGAITVSAVLYTAEQVQGQVAHAIVLMRHADEHELETLRSCIKHTHGAIVGRVD